MKAPSWPHPFTVIPPQPTFQLANSFMTLSHNLYPKPPSPALYLPLQLPPHLLLKTPLMLGHNPHRTSRDTMARWLLHVSLESTPVPGSPVQTGTVQPYT